MTTKTPIPSEQASADDWDAEDDDEPFGTVECRFCGGRASWRTVSYTDPLWHRYSQEDQLECWNCGAILEVDEQEPW